MSIAFTTQSGATQAAITAAINMYTAAVTGSAPLSIICNGEDGSPNCAAINTGFLMLVSQNVLNTPFTPAWSSSIVPAVLPKVATVASAWQPGEYSASQLTTNLTAALLSAYTG